MGQRMEKSGEKTSKQSQGISKPTVAIRQKTAKVVRSGHNALKENITGRWKETTI